MENKEDMVGSSHISPLATEIIFTVTILTYLHTCTARPVLSRTYSVDEGDLDEADDG